jgi:hypothetical protein
LEEAETQAELLAGLPVQPVPLQMADWTVRQLDRYNNMIKQHMPVLVQDTTVLELDVSWTVIILAMNKKIGYRQVELDEAQGTSTGLDPS